MESNSRPLNYTSNAQATVLPSPANYMYVSLVNNDWKSHTLQAAQFSLAFSLLLLKFMPRSLKTLQTYHPVQNHRSCQDTVFTVLDCPIANSGKMLTVFESVPQYDKQLSFH